MAGELVQVIAGNNGAVNTTATTEPFPSNVTAGNTIVAIGNASTTTGTISFSDTKNTYNTAITLVDTTQTNSTLAIAVATNVQGGATSVTVNCSVSVYLELHILEFTQASAGGGVDQASGISGNSANPAAPAVTTTVNGEVIVAYGGFGGTPTAGSGFTQAGFIGGDMSEWGVQTTAGSISGAFTQSPSQVWAVVMATLKGPGISPLTVPSGNAITVPAFTAKYLFFDTGDYSTGV